MYIRFLEFEAWEFYAQRIVTMKKEQEYKGELIPSKAEEPDLAGYYSYEDYLQWSFEDMVELINGKIFKMAPAPSTGHQLLLMELSYLVMHHLRGKNCKVFVAPFDVRLSKFKEDKLVNSVVQPDLCIIFDSTKIDEKGCNGAPDMIVEILSPSTALRDLDLKFKLYEENGVKEYWIVQPNDQTVTIFDLVDSKFSLRGIYHRENIVEVKTIDLEIDLNEVFPVKD
jgi:Uma2 family endonuclease